MPQTQPLGPQFTTAEAAAYLGISMGHLRTLLRRKRIRALRDGRVRIYRAWCDEYIRRHETPSSKDVIATPTAQREGIRDLLPARRRFTRVRSALRKVV